MKTPPAPHSIPILLRYHEIAIKQGNRSWFEERLKANVLKFFARSHGEDFQKSLKIDQKQGRFVLYAPWTPDTIETLKRVFGLTSFSPAIEAATDFDAISTKAIEEIQRLRLGLPQNPTFRIRTKRSDKVLGDSSMHIDREIGSRVLDAFPEFKVELEKPDLSIGIEIRRRNSFIWIERIQALGGLPAATSSTALALLSGGIDSPVSAIQMIRRGARVPQVHFYGTPYVGEDVLEKIQRLSKLINFYQPRPQPLFTVPFGETQAIIARACTPRMRTLLYRRMMFRIAAKIAEKCGAIALVTGESLGQVASQTLENLAQIDAASSLPVLRPLIAYDKEEIIRRSEVYNTYTTSIEPTADCCTLFADRSPELTAKAEQVAQEESKLDIPALVQNAAQQAFSYIWS